MQSLRWLKLSECLEKKERKVIESYFCIGNFVPADKFSKVTDLKRWYTSVQYQVSIHCVGPSM